MVQIADNIKKYRNLRGFSQQKVADDISEKRSTYAEWEQGTEPKASVLLKLARVFGVTLADLLEGTAEAEIIGLPGEVTIEPSLNQEHLLSTIQHLSQSNDNLIKQHDKIIGANTIIAETNRLLAEQLIKERPTANDVVSTQKETVATVKALKEHLFELESQVTKKSVREIKQAFHNKVKQVKDPV
jgi:transcriptional regulator with XRE-family HTH domain